MFRTLLTPLVARFDLSPRNPQQDLPQTIEDDNEIDPEEFARDVMVELMRNSVDNLKMAEEGKVQVQVLSEIQRIMAQDANTKDIFRELDGFLILMSLLSTIQDRQSNSGPVVEPEEQILSEVLEITRLIFVNLDEAMHGNSQNTEYFKNTVTYASLSSSLSGLLSNPATTDHTLGLLLSLALHNFALSPIFTSLRAVSQDDLDFEVSKLEPVLKSSTMERSEVILILWNSIQSAAVPAEDTVVRYATYKIFEMLSKSSHRNLAVLSSLEALVGSVLERFCETRSDTKDSMVLSEGKEKAGDAKGKTKEGKGKTAQEKERHVLQKLLRRLLDMGAGTKEARMIFQRAIKEDGENGLDAEMLDLLRFGMKSRWLEHFSLEGEKASLVLEELEAAKGLPGSGFTFMMWLWISSVPTSDYSLFTISLSPPPTSTPTPKAKVENLNKTLISLRLRQDGNLELVSSANRDPVVFDKAKFQRSRWTHITLVHYPHRNSNPSIRLFIDGVLLDSINWSYPKLEWKDSQLRTSYIVGDAQEGSKMSWCLASAYLVALPLGDDIPRFVHHLGARYTSNFQDPALVRFLTYEASTSLNMFLTTIAAQHQGSQSSTSSGLMKIVQNGLSLPESAIMFSVSAVNSEEGGLITTVQSNSASGSGSSNESRVFRVQGDVFAVKAKCLDVALWKSGGAAVALRLVQVANSQHELSRALGVLTDGLRNSWQNSEDMERLHGYDILGDILRSKSQMINITGFETVFEFLGMNFRTPEQSAVVNTIAYRAIALDFELWSQTKKEIQQLYLEHFVILLETSRYKKFNSRQRLAKLDLVRKILFALQTSWYDDAMIPSLMESLKAAMQANFAKEETIKPVVTYVAANLHQESRGGAASPRSTISRIDYIHPREKAEQVFDILISLLSIQSYHTKFAAALPLTRICLLLLGDKPSPLIANRVLTLIGISNTFTSSFSRKFELVSGWSVLKTVLPYCWDQTVNQAAFDVMLGRYNHVLDRSLKKGSGAEGNVVVCSNILPAILASLAHGLADVAKASEDGLHLDVSSPSSSSLESNMEALVEQIMDLHASSTTFRQIFKSQQTTQIFADGLKSFVNEVSTSQTLNQPARGILEKIIHLGLAIALDPTISGSQKREILDSVQKGDAVLNPTSDKLSIDPSLIEDTRTVRQRFASARFSIHVNERTIIKTITRMQEWRQTIETSEKKRLRKTLLDLRETRRQVSNMYDWTTLLTSERGLWPAHETRMWRLDETEGPYRVRKKLEPQNDEASTSRVDAQDEETRQVAAPDADTTSLHQAEVPPWAEGYEISSTETDDKLAEEVSDDKHRRIRHELEPGDVIEAVSTVARIVGVDSSPGLLILGRTHIYILDGLVENDDGEVVDAHDAPKRLFFVPGSIVELDGPQRAQRWHHDQIASYSEKTFLFRDVALEVYFKDSRSLLVTFLDKKKRADVDQKLSHILYRNAATGPVTPGVPKTPMFGTKSMSSWRTDQLLTAQRKWQAREISNFTYLCILNQISGRTPSDATQYPVFPWVIGDYSSSELDLLSPATFRDLTKPMGALTDARRDAAETRYTNLESVDEEPFHYGTHFSSSMIVCHYLIRLAPFTNMFKTLQGGDWDLPDRLFTDISRAWESASSDVRGDVRELIPEFYTCPEFLENAANLDFGVQQNTGERIHDVKLPPWARDDPLLFIVLNRRALESAHVSEHLPAWIDLIWGCKQRDPDSTNVFHPLSYEGSIDLDTITDELEREAKVGIIHNFGQTPRKLFDTLHPERNNHGLASLPLGTLHGVEEDPHLLIQGARCFKDLGTDTPIRTLAVDVVGNKIVPCPVGVLTVPTHPHEQVEWNEKGSELRILVDHKTVQVVESACCTCAAFADGHTLVTGSSDFTVRLWKLSRSPATRVALSHIMRIHTNKVTCVTASRTWSTVVSGSEDGSAALWDLNRGVYVRSIWHATEGAADEMTAVNLVAINESTGYIATCSRSTLLLHTINARVIAKLDLTTTPSYSKLVPTVTAMAFHEREYSPLGVLATGGADGTITLRTWTADGTPEGEKAQWEFVTIRTMKARMVGRGITRPPSITALRFSGETLIHGEETGKAYVWSLPDS